MNSYNVIGLIKLLYDWINFLNNILFFFTSKVKNVIINDH